MTSQSYVGRELELFALAENWKRYWSSLVIRYLHGKVLEVGAGIGANTRYMKSSNVSSWTCLEPDPELALQMRAGFQAIPQLHDCRVEVGTTETIKKEESFDAILYIDVLEHISDDQSEMQRASNLLRAGGMLIVLAPAQEWLYTPFDRAIGHVRRYTKETLRRCSPPNCLLSEMVYLDSVGVIASAGNRLFLSRAMPTRQQILFWDRYLVPFSRIIDRMIFRSFGKSILGVWTKA